MIAPKKPDKNSGGLSDRAANIIVITVAAIWAVSMSASIVTSLVPQLPDYQPPQYIHGAFLAVVGTALALRGKSKDDDEKDDG